MKNEEKDYILEKKKIFSPYKLMESGHSLSQVSSLKLISEELVLYQILKVEATCQTHYAGIEVVMV